MSTCITWKLSTIFMPNMSGFQWNSLFVQLLTFTHDGCPTNFSHSLMTDAQQMKIFEPDDAVVFCCSVAKVPCLSEHPVYRLLFFLVCTQAIEIPGNDHAIGIPENDSPRYSGRLSTGNVEHPLEHLVGLGWEVGNAHTLWSYLGPNPQEG